MPESLIAHWYFIISPIDEMHTSPPNYGTLHIGLST